MNCASRAITSLAFGPGRGVNKIGNLASLVIVPTVFSTEVLQQVWLRCHDPHGAECVPLSPGSWACRSIERDHRLIYAEVGRPSRKGNDGMFTLRHSPDLHAFQ